MSQQDANTNFAPVIGVSCDATLKPLSQVGISEKALAQFAQAGIETVAQLLAVLPLRYQDRSKITPIAQLMAGEMAQIVAQVVECRVVYGGSKRMLVVSVQDAQGGACILRYFRFFPSQQKAFENGRWGVFYGKVQWGRVGVEVIHPEVRWQKEAQTHSVTRKIVAVYPSIEKISASQHQRAVEKALAVLIAEKDALTEKGQLSYAEAMRSLHQPESSAELSLLLTPQHVARKRLILEELSAHQLLALQAKQLRGLALAPVLPLANAWQARLQNALPFELTEAQLRVIAEIGADLAKSQPMLRLLQGDVGSGKTVVAAMVALQAIAAGAQVALMSPTELLAVQHARKLAELLMPLGISVRLLLSKLGAKEKREVLAEIADGRAQLVVGTHALFQKQVKYQNLALVIIDEQHRFGVQQRLWLKEKVGGGETAHQLVMTATPIPRTLAMSAYGEMDISVIDAMPKGREPVQTSVVSNAKREALMARVGEVCRGGRQAYWVCPLIEESDALECENAEAIAEQLRLALPFLRIALVHGRLPSAERQALMRDFADGAYDLLVATTVIEVGVDVPNASLMVIENAERFGLAQLHQLRGRVGRGGGASFCVLMYQQPLSQTAKKRLTIMRQTTDGFVIAEEDLALRGAGEVFGTRQTGITQMQVADIQRDVEELAAVSKWCWQWLEEDNPLARLLPARWLGEKKAYWQV